LISHVAPPSLEATTWVTMGASGLWGVHRRPLAVEARVRCLDLVSHHAKMLPASPGHPSLLPVEELPTAEAQAARPGTAVQLVLYRPDHSHRPGADAEDERCREEPERRRGRRECYRPDDPDPSLDEIVHGTPPSLSVTAAVTCAVCEWGHQVVARASARDGIRPPPGGSSRSTRRSIR